MHQAKVCPQGSQVQQLGIRICTAVHELVPILLPQVILWEINLDACCAGQGEGGVSAQLLVEQVPEFISILRIQWCICDGLQQLCELLGVAHPSLPGTLA